MAEAAHYGVAARQPLHDGFDDVPAEATSLVFAHRGHVLRSPLVCPFGDGPAEPDEGVPVSEHGGVAGLEGTPLHLGRVIGHTGDFKRVGAGLPVDAVSTCF